FTASFQRDGQGWSQLEPAHLGTLENMLSHTSRPVHLLGEGIPYHEKFIPRDDPGVIVTPPEFWPARAEVVVTLGWALARAGSFIDPMQLVPIYIRRPEAEEKFEAGKR
ncbi:MAG TPA: hypothetical protein VHX12_07575, partial [Acidisoma sp.]|nr:hypothetical protein [Acidisoma sp.]